jgi:hypothetical protein
VSLTTGKGQRKNKHNALEHVTEQQRASLGGSSALRDYLGSRYRALGERSTKDVHKGEHVLVSV